MDKKISDKQVFDLIAEFAKTSDATITSKELKKEFQDEPENDNNANIIIVEQNDENRNPDLDSSEHQEILPLLNSIHSSIANIQKVKNNESVDLQVDEILTFLKNNLDEKIVTIEQKLNEIIFKNQSSKFLLEDTKNILASSKLQQAELEKIKIEVLESTKVFKEHKPFTNEEINELKNDFIKITATQFQKLEERINNAEANILKIKEITPIPPDTKPLITSAPNTKVVNKNRVAIPKWFAFVTILLIGTLITLFFYLLNSNNNNQIKDTAPLNSASTEVETPKTEVPTEVEIKKNSEVFANSNKNNVEKSKHVATPIISKKTNPSKNDLKLKPIITSQKEIMPLKKKISTSNNTNNTTKSSNNKNSTPPEPNDVFFGRD